MNQETRTPPPATTAPTASREHGRERGREPGAESITGLIRNLAADVSALLGKEMALAKSEVRESVSEVKTAVGAIATGAAIAMAGLVILLLSGVYGLSNVVDPWLAALIVGATALLVGFLMVNAAKKTMSASEIMPERTVESAKKDKETFERSIQ